MAITKKSSQRRGQRKTVQGEWSKNKDQLKSNGASRMSVNPAVRKDQFGSVHNHDARKKAQEQRGRQHGQNVPFRESSQDTPPSRGFKNRQPGSRRQKTGGQLRRSCPTTRHNDVT